MFDVFCIKKAKNFPIPYSLIMLCMFKLLKLYIKENELMKNE